jgi:opacity protein-like surface antigen
MRARTQFLGWALALAVLPYAAPPAAAAGTRVSLKGGLSMATLLGTLPTSSLVSNGYRNSAGGGIAVTFAGRGRWAFQPEALYVSKGTSYGKSDLTDPVGNVTGSVETSLVIDYLEFPLLARYGFRPEQTLSPYLLAGTAVGFRTRQDFEISGDIEGKTGVDFFRPADLGLAFGTGFELGHGRYRGLLEARYTLGILNVGRDPFSSDVRNGDLLVMAGVSFRP